MLYGRPCRVAITCVASCYSPIIGVDGFLRMTKAPISAVRFLRSSTALCVNRLQDCAILQNNYFALRHGQSEANVAKIIASGPQIACHQYGLSSNGREQAQQAGEAVVKFYLEQHNNGKAFHGLCLLSSDLLRAKETAEIVAIAVQNHNQNNPTIRIPLWNNQVITETRLRERWFGEWDLSSDENYEKVWKDDAVDPSHRTLGVESVNSVMDRVTECILEWDLRMENHMIVCVAHGDVLQILQTSFCKLDGSKHRTLDHLETATLRKLELSLAVE